MCGGVFLEKKYIFKLKLVYTQIKLLTKFIYFILNFYSQFIHIFFSIFVYCKCVGRNSSK